MRKKVIIALIALVLLIVTALAYGELVASRAQTEEVLSEPKNAIEASPFDTPESEALFRYYAGEGCNCSE